MGEFLSTYYESIGMTPANVITTIFGFFIFSFVVSLCWGKLVKDFGPIGGIMASGIIVGSIWVMNHALPGVGLGALCEASTFSPETGIAQTAHQWVGGVFVKDAVGNNIQSGLIFQSARFGGPWVDMGWAAAVGLWIGSIYAGASLKKSLPTLIAAIIGGIIGGVLLGLVSYGWAV